MQEIRRRLTYANAMATIAVVLSLGGATAFAASQLGKRSVGTKQLKPNAVTGAKVMDGALAGADIDSSTLGQVPAATSAERAVQAITAERADGAPPVGPAGGDLGGIYPNPVIGPNAVDSTKIVDEAVGGAELAGLIEVTDNFVGRGIVHSAGSANILSASCPAGSRVLSGGFDTGVIGTFVLSASRQFGNGWAVQGVVPGPEDIAVRVFAYCLARAD